MQLLQGLGTQGPAPVLGQAATDVQLEPMLQGAGSSDTADMVTVVDPLLLAQMPRLLDIIPAHLETVM